MNPYDFVPIDWDNPNLNAIVLYPHDRFKGISGKIQGTITAKDTYFHF